MSIFKYNRTDERVRDLNARLEAQEISIKLLKNDLYDLRQYARESYGGGFKSTTGEVFKIVNRPGDL